MLNRLYRKLFRKASKPVTSGWVEYRGLMTVVSFAAERNYVLTLVENTPDREYAWYVLRSYLDGQRTASEVIADLEAEGATI